MSTILNPYISFRGNAREAISFYGSVFGGVPTMTTFGEAHMPVAPDELEQIMHAQLIAPNNMTLMVSDSPAHMSYQPGTNVQLSLSGTDEAELRGYWDGLAEGATISQPLEKAPWGDIFGMLVDKFDINWLVNITAKKD